MDNENKSKRTYRLKKRAEMMAETRRRIAAAAAELHGTVGPARTSLSAIAIKAGVQRHTLYRHFPTDTALFKACSAHFFTDHPLPDPEPWRDISDPLQRLQRVLTDLYDYYARTEGMFTNVLRDAEFIKELRLTLGPMEAFLADTAELLTIGWGTSERRRTLLAAASRHVVNFQTWRSLTVDNHLTQSDAIELVANLIKVAAGSRTRSTP